MAIGGVSPTCRPLSQVFLKKHLLLWGNKGIPYFEKCHQASFLDCRFIVLGDPSVLWDLLLLLEADVISFKICVCGVES